MSGDLVRVKFDKCKGMSDSAVLLDVDSECYWIPFSEIIESSGLQYNERDCWVVIPEWMAIAKGLDQYAEEYDGE